MEVINSYEFLELNRFYPHDFKSSNKLITLNLGMDQIQSSFSVQLQIDNARRELLSTVLCNLSSDSWDQEKLGLVARVVVYFRPPYEEELEKDKKLILSGYNLQKDPLSLIRIPPHNIYPGEIKIARSPRVKNIKAIVRVFDGQHPDDLGEILTSIDLECEDNYNIVPQPYEIFEAYNGMVRYQMFTNEENYDPRKPSPLFRTLPLVKNGKLTTKKVAFSNTFNPYF